MIYSDLTQFRSLSLDTIFTGVEPATSFDLIRFPLLDVYLFTPTHTNSHQLTPTHTNPHYLYAGVTSSHTNSRQVGVSHTTRTFEMQTISTAQTVEHATWPELSLFRFILV